MSLLSRNRPSDDLPELDAGVLAELDAGVLAELDALDAALAGEEITDEALAALVRDVRAAAPEMRPEAMQHLNERVTERFGTPGMAPGERAGARRRFSAPVLAAASIVLVGMVVSVGILTRERDDSGGLVSAPSMESHATPATASSASAAPATSGVATDPDQAYRAADAVPLVAGGAPSAAKATGSGAASSTTLQSGETFDKLSPADSPDARSTNRAVERSVDLQVRVKNGGLPDAAAKVSRITRDANGYVATSDLSLGGKGSGTATFSLRVDSSKLDRAIDRLSGLGTVTAQNESSRDITSAVDSAQGRLDDANRVRKALLRALAKAESDGEIASLRLRIAENRRLRASLDAQLQQVQRRADLTTIAFTLTAPWKGDPAADDGNWSLGDAVSDAWSILRTVLGGLLVGAAFAAPFALLAAIGWVVFRIRRRRARERTLDA